jgi:hypothetical protein
MSSQTQIGKAFEYAVVLALQELIGQSNSGILNSEAIESASKNFDDLATLQEENLVAARAAVSQLLKLEPQLRLAAEGKSQIQLAVQSDQKGKEGDVRDVIISEPTTGWEIGISAKHNHQAVKHSRLSMHIDFGKDWLGLSCSPEYFAAIAPIFARLDQLRDKGLLWSEVPNKQSEVYVPVLAAFKNEIENMEKKHPGVVARQLISYLIGNKDFYKVMKLGKQTKIQAFNFNGKLNLAIQRIRPDVHIEKLKLPMQLVKLERRAMKKGPSPTTLEMICDAGWQLSFRIHSAKSSVESSLKFDINVIGQPRSLYTCDV